MIHVSQKIQLNNHVIDFFSNLLIKLSNEEASAKKMRTFLMDLFYTLWVREKQNCLTNNFKNKIDEIFSSCSKNTSILITLMDVIDVLNDPNKKKSLPIAFLTESNELLSDKNRFTADDFERSNVHFDSIVNQELIRFMNNDSKIDSAFDEFLMNLPTESKPNPTFYKIYPSLSTIPADCIQIRIKFIYSLNMIFRKVQTVVDLSLIAGESFLVDEFRKIKSYLLYDKKFKLFEECLEKTSSGDLDKVTVEFDVLKADANSTNGENTMFYQAFTQLHKNAHRQFRSDNERLWEASYINMHSIDAGGPYRDSITRMCSDICSTRLPLFILCPNGRTNVGLNRDCWIPNTFSPQESIPNKLAKQYRFVGQLMGMAMRKKNYLDLKFPSLLWKQLTREPVTMKDIESIDIQSFKIIEEVERNFSQNKFTDGDTEIKYLFSSIMSDLRFDVISSAGQTFELVPGGKEILITASNFNDYCVKYREYRLNEFHRQIEFICQGFYSVVPFYYLSIFTANELEEAVCGKGCIDIDLLKRNTHYSDGNHQDSLHIQWFWTVLSDMFNEEQKKSFILFVWGRSTLPRCDQEFTSKFHINSYYGTSDDVDSQLPRKIILI